MGETERKEYFDFIEKIVNEKLYDIDGNIRSEKELINAIDNEYLLSRMSIAVAISAIMERHNEKLSIIEKQVREQCAAEIEADANNWRQPIDEALYAAARIVREGE